MTQIVGLPINDAEKLGRVRLTEEQNRNARSLDNLYRLAIGQINKHPEVNVWFGKTKRAMPATELMVALKNCKELLGVVPINSSDFSFFKRLLVRLGKTPQTNIEVKELLRLRKIARGESSPNETPDPDEVEKKKKIGKLRALLGIARGRATIAKNRRVEPKIHGCSYLDSHTGVRCGFPCEEGNLCEEHKDYTPPRNGHGSLFYATNIKESNPHRR